MPVFVRPAPEPRHERDIAKCRKAAKLGLLSRFCTTDVHVLYRLGRRGRDVEKSQILRGFALAGGPGFEPRLTESESAVLPLNYPPPKQLITNSFQAAYMAESPLQIGPATQPYIEPSSCAVYHL